jgi:hypothetical protein
VYALIQPFLRLCLLSAGPQDLPSSRFLLGVCLILYASVTVAAYWPHYGFAVSGWRATVEIALLFVFTWGALALRGHPARFLQTMTALLGSGAMFGALLLPLVYAVIRAEMLREPATLPALTSLAVFIWWLVVMGHIFRHALAFRHLGPGLLVALALIGVGVVLVEPLFPEASY